MKKKMLALLLALVLAFSLLPVSGAAAHTKTVYLKTGEREYQNGILGRYTSFSYDANGNLTKEDRRVREDHDLTSFDSRIEYSYAYNAQGDVIRTEFRNKGELVLITEQRFTYTEQSTKRAVYEHPVIIDANLTEYRGYHETFYDAAGNEIRVMDYDANDKLQNSREYAYDANGNKISETRYSYNSSGGATAIGKTQYEYDAQNRLTREYDADHPEEIWTAYTYDASGRLAKKEWSQINGPDNGAVYPFTTVYTYDRNGNLSSETTSVRSRPREAPLLIVTNTVRIDYTYTAFEITVPPPFEDVEPDGYYRDAVEWAVENGVTNGTSKTTFSPDKACTRAEAVTFLWRAKGEPEPKAAATRFSDVPADTWYSKAVAWAVETGVTNGFPDGSFRPNDTCTRAQIVTFLWRANNSPVPKDGGTCFPDVPADEWYSSSVAWAVETKVTNGFPDGTFGLNDDCTRSQIVTFLYRATQKQ